MPLPIVDIEKSLKRSRLVFKLTGSYVFNTVLIYLAALILIAAFVMALLNSKISHPPIVTLITCLIVLWVIANLILTNSLVKIEGKDIASNRAAIKDCLESFYNDIDLQPGEQRMIRNFKPAGWLNWGRIITVIFDENSIYINITTLGRGNSASPFHGFSNYLKCSRMARYIRNRQ